MARRWELDLLRGLMLVLMFVTHMPTRFSNPLGQPFGYVSAAEGFVMLSAFMAGMIYTARAEKNGIPAMQRAFFSRALTIYACHAALLLFLFSVIAALGLSRNQPALINLIGFYLSNPWAGLWGGLLMIYDPPLLDILPLYIVLLLASPWILTRGLRHGWTGIFIVSLALWAGAQFRISATLYEHFVAWTNLQVPYKETGAFESYAWQFLWVFGLWMGASTAQGSLNNRKPFPKHLVIAAATVALICFLWRHAAGQVPIPGNGDSLVNQLFDKWHLGPLRLINFFALVILLMHFSDWLSSHVPRMAFLEKLGAASLPVFCVHLVIVLLALSVAGASNDPGRSFWLDVCLLAAGFFILYITALITLYLDKEEREKIKAARLERAQKRMLTQKGAMKPLD